MTKIGRNEPCPCGSGKKYKKCCIGKELPPKPKENLQTFADQFLSYEEVDEMSTDEIIKRLKTMGVGFKKEKFLNDVKTSYAAEEISEGWFDKYNITVQGREEDFPCFAARILWERMAPQGHLSAEQIDEIYHQGIDALEQNDPISACDEWLAMWEVLKDRNSPIVQNLNFLDEKYKSTFFVRNFCQDLELELHNAGIRNSAYFEKCVTYCSEFLEIFPNESELIIHNMRRAIADSYGELGQYEKAESEYQNLVRDFSANPWSYIAWGDFYTMIQEENHEKAKELYEKALEV